MNSGRLMIGITPTTIRYLDLRTLERRAGTAGFPISTTANLSSAEQQALIDSHARAITTSMERLRVLRKENLFAYLDSIGASQQQKDSEFNKLQEEGLARLDVFTEIYKLTNNSDKTTFSKLCKLDSCLTVLEDEIRQAEQKHKLTKTYNEARQVLKRVDLIENNPSQTERRLKKLNLFFMNNEITNIKNMIDVLNAAIDADIKARNATETLYNKAISLWAEVYSITQDQFNAEQDLEKLETAKNSYNISFLQDIAAKFEEQKKEINRELSQAHAFALNYLKEVAHYEKSEIKAAQRFNDFDAIYKTKNLKDILLAVDKLRNEVSEIYRIQVSQFPLAQVVIPNRAESPSEDKSDLEKGYDAEDEAEEPTLLQKRSSFFDEIDPKDLVEDQEIEEITANQSQSNADAERSTYHHQQSPGPVEVEMMTMGKRIESDSHDEADEEKSLVAAYTSYVSGMLPSSTSNLRAFGSKPNSQKDLTVQATDFKLGHN